TAGQERQRVWHGLTDGRKAAASRYAPKCRSTRARPHLVGWGLEIPARQMKKAARSRRNQEIFALLPESIVAQEEKTVKVHFAGLETLFEGCAPTTHFILNKREWCPGWESNKHYF